MSKQASDQISEGLTEALAVARDEARPHKIHVPPELDVKAVRAQAELSHMECEQRFRAPSSPQRGEVPSKARR